MNPNGPYPKWYIDLYMQNIQAQIEADIMGVPTCQVLSVHSEILGCWVPIGPKQNHRPPKQYPSDGVTS